MKIYVTSTRQQTRNNKYSAQGKTEDTIKIKNQEVISKQHTMTRSYMRIVDKRTIFPSKKYMVTRSYLRAADKKISSLQRTLRYHSPTYLRQIKKQSPFRSQIEILASTTQIFWSRIKVIQIKKIFRCLIL